MFSILDMINRYLGYLNMNAQIKNRIYSFVGLFGVLYLYYIAIRFIVNQYLLRGTAILLVAIVFTYFLYLNFYYFFSHRQAPFDISPHLAKLLRIKPKPAPNGRTPNAPGQVQNARPGDLNGHFAPQHVLPAQMISSSREMKNINHIAADMLVHQLLRNDYLGRDDRQINQKLQENNGHPLYAIDKGALIPYFRLKLENGNYVVYAGLNSANCFKIGILSRIGLQSVKELNANKIQLYPASLILMGGNYKTLGRNEVIDHVADYTVRVRVAFEK